jgi:hypothetical protein
MEEEEEKKEKKKEKLVSLYRYNFLVYLSKYDLVAYDEMSL